MTTQDQIDALQAQIDRLKEEQQRCQHNWGDTYSNPRKTKEQVATGKLIQQGSDAWPETRLQDVEVPRWSRKCTKCGLVQHTERMREVKQPIKVEPHFE